MTDILNKKISSADNKKVKRAPSSKPSKRVFKQALALPGMESHIKRLKAFWKSPMPSDEVLERWLIGEIAKQFYRKRLLKMSLTDLIDLLNDIKDKS
jgi:hypothetical protein